MYVHLLCLTLLVLALQEAEPVLQPDTELPVVAWQHPPANLPKPPSAQVPAMSHTCCSHTLLLQLGTPVQPLLQAATFLPSGADSEQVHGPCTLPLHCTTRLGCTELKNRAAGADETVWRFCSELDADSGGHGACWHPRCHHRQLS